MRSQYFFTNKTGTNIIVGPRGAEWERNFRLVLLFFNFTFFNFFLIQFFLIQSFVVNSKKIYRRIVSY